LSRFVKQPLNLYYVSVNSSLPKWDRQGGAI